MYAATAEQAAEVCTAIRATIRNLYGARVARSITIQYVLNGPGDAGEILVDHAASANVGMSHLAVAHLPR